MWDHHVPINNVSRYTQSCRWVFTVLTSFFFCAPTILEVSVAILASVFAENVRKLNDENLTVVFNTTIKYGLFLPNQILQDSGRSLAEWPSMP